MQGYAERKLIFVHQLITSCREYHSDAVRQQRLGVTLRHATQDILEKPLKQSHRTTRILPEPKDHVLNTPQRSSNGQSIEDATGSTNSPIQANKRTIKDQSSRLSTPQDQPRSLPELLCGDMEPAEAGAAAPSAEAFPLEDEESDENGAHPAFFTRASPVGQFGLASNDSDGNSDEEFVIFGSGLTPTHLNSMPQSNAGRVDYCLEAARGSSQGLENLYTCIKKLESGISWATMDIYALRNATQAHLAVLESRISALERRPQAMPISNGAPTAWTGKNCYSAQLEVPVPAYNSKYSTLGEPQHQADATGNWENGNIGARATEMAACQSHQQAVFRTQVRMPAFSSHPGHCETTVLPAAQHYDDEAVIVTPIPRCNMTGCTPSNSLNWQQMPKSSAFLGHNAHGQSGAMPVSADKEVTAECCGRSGGALDPAAVLQSLKGRLEEAQTVLAEARIGT